MKRIKKSKLASMDFSGPWAANRAVVMAHCASAKAHNILYVSYDQTPQRLARADAAINAALRLQPDLPEVHLAMARHLYHCYRDYDGARKQLAIAKRGLPNNVKATNLEARIDLRQGKRDKAIKGVRKALTRDPLNVSSLNFLGQLLCMKRRFDEAVPFFDRMIRLKPDVPMLKVNKAYFTRFLKTGDTGPVRSAIAALPQSAAEDPDLLDMRVWLALVEHNWSQAEQLIEKMKSRHIDTNVPAIRLAPAEWNSVLLARLRKEPTTNPAFAEVREQLNVKVLQAPQDAELLSILAVLDALLDRKETAISEAKRAVEMLPVSKDALVGSVILINLAIVYTWTGELDLAISTLEPLTKRPYGNPYYGELKREPWWEPLRQDPRYNKLLAELASKD
jgi:tetratricopeptide (TPR) repeat protein